MSDVVASNVCRKNMFCNQTSFNGFSTFFTIYCIDKRFGMVSSTEYSFKAKISSLGCHVFEETTWSNVKEGDSVIVDLETNKFSKNIDPYACAIRAKNQFLTRGKRWDISREKFLVMFIILSRQKVVL